MKPLFSLNEKNKYLMKKWKRNDFVSLKMEIFLSPMNENLLNYQKVTEHHFPFLLPASLLTTKPFKINTKHH